MRVRGGSPTLWRRPGESQVGTEAGLAVVLKDLSPADQRLVDRLPAITSSSDLVRVARWAHVPARRARDLVGVLTEAGVMVPGDDRGPLTPDEAYWDRLGHDPARRSGILDSAVVGLHGRGDLVSLTAYHLARAGVGTLLLEDDGLPADTAARSALTDALSRMAPGLRTRANLRTLPDVVVLVSSGTSDPLRVRRLVQEGVTHLPVVVGEVTVQVGPLVVPGRTACATCLDLWRRDADPCWPVLAAQLHGRRPVVTEDLLTHQAAATAARAVLCVLTGSGQEWEGRSLELGGPSSVPAQRLWEAHPACGCCPPPA